MQAFIFFIILCCTHIAYIKTGNQNGTPLNLSDKNIFFMHWPSLGQPEGNTCGFDAAKNSKHMLDFATGRINQEALITRLEADIDTEHYPLAICQVTAKSTADLDQERIETVLQKVYKLSPSQVTVIPSPEQYNPESIRDDQFAAIKKTVSALAYKTPFSHAFILGNMQQKPGQLKGTFGHWIALVIQITQDKRIIFHYADSAGGLGSKNTIHHFIKILNRDITKDEIRRNFINKILTIQNVLEQHNSASALARITNFNKEISDEKIPENKISEVFAQEFNSILRLFNEGLIFNLPAYESKTNQFLETTGRYWIPLARKNMLDNTQKNILIKKLHELNNQGALNQLSRTILSDLQ